MQMRTGIHRRSGLMVVLGMALTLVAAMPARAGSPLSNDPSPLAICQEIVRAASLGLATDARRAMASCLLRGIECLLNDPATAGACCARVAGKCDGAFAKLATASRRFTNHLTRRRCATVPFAGIVADLGYAELFPACRALDPAVEVTDLEGLAECLRRVVVGATTCQIATLELPRSAEALACLGLEEAFVAATGTDPLSCRAPAASPTATPSATGTATALATPTPLPTGTTTALPTGTATQVASATATPAATTVPTATATTIPGATATTTAIPLATRTATPVPAASATPSGPVCGNGAVEQGESCDDGNTADCDACPSDCHAAPADCTAQTTRHTQQVRITGPTELGAVQVCLTYPAGTIGLPGTGTVAGRISGFAGSNNVVDFNNAVQVALLPAGSQSQFTFTLSFDRCSGAPVPDVLEFTCVTKDASDTLGNAINPPTIVECTPTTTP